MNFNLVNPLDLYGPEFLVFYLAVGTVINILVRSAIRLKEGGGDLAETRLQFESAKLTDPYEIAYLRGGPNEAVRVASVSLIDRGLLTVEGDNDNRLKTKDNRSVDLANKAIEKWVLLKCLTSQRASDLFFDPTLADACKAYEDKLEHHGLLPNPDQIMARRMIVGLGLLILIGLAVTKILVALSRGRHNIIFLIILCVLFSYFVAKASRKRRTRNGDRFISDLKSLFSSLRTRGKFMKAGGATNELALLTAVFGLSAASSDAFPYIKKVYAKSTALTSTSSCGTSCGAYGYGTSCSGGGGCGGGGCGGGCGGCGG
jgi:uncharacterized protein (TIGR04222 family)